MSAAQRKAVKVTDSTSGSVTHYPSEVTVTTSGNLVVNVTELLGTAAAKRQIDALKEITKIEQKKK